MCAAGGARLNQLLHEFREAFLAVLEHAGAARDLAEADAKARLENARNQLASAKEELGKPFPQEEELKTKSARLAVLDAELNLDRTAHPPAKEKSTEEPDR